MDVFEMITAQQKGRECTPVYMVGQQLKDICREDPHNAEIVAQDLQNKSMSLEACEKKIKAWADEHKPGPKAPCCCVPPDVAEKIIREFYGLPEMGLRSGSEGDRRGPAGLAMTEKTAPRNDSSLLGLLDLI